MRILMVAHKMPYPPTGGATLRNFNLMKECSQDNEIHLLTFTQEPYLRDPEKMKASIAGLKQYCKEVEVFQIPGHGSRLRFFLLLFLNLFSLTPYSLWKFRSSKMINAVKMHLATYDFDLMEINCISLVDYARLAGDMPKLLIHHNVESQLLYRRSRSAKGFLTRAYLALQAYKLRRLEKKVCQSFDHHTTVSELDKKTLQSVCPGIRATVVDNGVDTDYFKPLDVPQEENTLVYAGGMSWYPNSEAMLYLARDIWPLIKTEIPDIKITIVGGDPPAELLEYGRKEPGINIAGFVDDVRPFVSRAAVYVVPITVGGGTRLKILDAMSMGKAIISTSVGCEGIDVEDGRNIIIADDPREFASKTVNLLRDKGLRIKLGTAARETAIELYSWKKIAPELQKVYDTMVIDT